MPDYMLKLYCAIDESGQDTSGALFIVTVVIIARENVEQARHILERIERESGKGRVKWTRSQHIRRRLYLERILSEPDLAGSLYYAAYNHSTEYPQMTATAAAAALQAYTELPYKALVLLDGLQRNERRAFAALLRRAGVKTDKVRGIDEQADCFIRLADALCGFVRDAGSTKGEYGQWLAKAEENKIIRPLK